MCIPRVHNFIEKLFAVSWFTIFYPSGVTKMYRDMKKIYWRQGMKKIISQFVLKCQNHTLEKYEHHRHATLQIMSILEWIWERIAIELMIGLPKAFG